MAEPTKRSVTISGHRTSISLEAEFWDALREIAADRGLAMQRLIEEIDASRSGEGLSTAARLFVLRYYRERAGSL